MRLFIFVLVCLLGTTALQAQVKYVPKDLMDEEIEVNQPALILLSDIYDNRNRLSAEGQAPNGRAMAYSRQILQDADKAVLDWLKERGYITTSIYEDRSMDKLYPLIHLNPEVEWRAVSGASTPVEYTLSTALAKSGYHKRKAWTMQAAALGVLFFGSGLTYYFASLGRRRLTVFMGFATGVTNLGLQIAFLVHKIKEGKTLEAIPGGVRFRF